MLLSFLVQLLFRTHYARVELIILQPELRFNVLCVTNQWPVFYPIYHLLRLTTLFPRKKETSFNTSHNILALQALKKTLDFRSELQQRSTTSLSPTLRTRCARKKSQCDLSANLRKLTDLEERMLMEHIIDLDT